MTGSSAVTTNSPASSLLSRRDIRPSRRNLAVAARGEIQPRRASLQPVVDRGAKVVDLPAEHRQTLGPLVGLQPHAPHLRSDLACPIGSDTSARAVTQRLRAVHRAGQARGMQHALPAHLTTPDGSLDRVLDAREQTGWGHAGTFSRRSSISSLAFLTADEASAE